MSFSIFDFRFSTEWWSDKGHPETEDSAVATKALSRDVGKDCTSPVCTAPDGPVIKDGDFLLGTAP
ncbi:unnamed protein product, partial [Ectocarpus sp. 8 AP-2014]